MADINWRSSCDSDCGDCRFLITNRRRDKTPWWHWSFNERRIASNWIPTELQLEEGLLSERFSRGNAGTFIWAMIILLLTFNALDAVLTARALSLGFTEANPAMAGLFAISVPLGMACKFAVVAGGAYILWRFRQAVLATRGMAVLTGCYGAVVIYHLVFQLSL
ncbi:hypothetical protein BMS3Abin01_00820 [bacterium BMS3Abin01]|nr:hypothetical protein BMS3Abin01_00820 [bacterium BMS3Abin01]